MIYPLDLRLRLVAVVCALFIFTPIKNLASAVIGLLLVLFVYLTARRSIPWRRLLHLEGFLILLLITLPFTIDGTELFKIGIFVATQEGVWRAVILALKVTTSVLLLSFYFAQEDPVNIGHALRGLYVPESLVRLFIAVVRYLSIFRGELNRLLESMKARGFVFRSNWHTWRSYGYLLGMLLVRALERAERTEEAMRLRSYKGHFLETALPRPKLTDWLSSVFIVMVSLLLFWWDLL